VLTLMGPLLSSGKGRIQQHESLYEPILANELKRQGLKPLLRDEGTPVRDNGHYPDRARSNRLGADPSGGRTGPIG